MKAKKYFPEHIFKKDGRLVYVDENYFIHKKESIKRMWFLACNNFYTITEHTNTYGLARILHEIDSSKSINSWSSFLYDYLFAVPNEKIINTKMTRGQYLFLRYSNWIIRRGEKE